jgi:hypothetical protein
MNVPTGFMGIGQPRGPVFGDCITTRVKNVVTGKEDVLIDAAPAHILIGDELVEDAFNQPGETFFGRLCLHPAPMRLFVVINGRNMCVEYQLTKHRPDERCWEAELTATLGQATQ